LALKMDDPLYSRRETDAYFHTAGSTKSGRLISPRNVTEKLHLMWWARGLLRVAAHRLKDVIRGSVASPIRPIGARHGTHPESASH
jgi:hypothetical protein